MKVNPLCQAFLVPWKHSFLLMRKQLSDLNFAILDRLFQRQSQSPPSNHSLSDYLHLSFNPQMKRNTLVAILRNPYQVSIHQYNTFRINP